MELAASREEIRHARSIEAELETFLADCDHHARNSAPIDALSYISAALPRVHALCRQARELYSSHHYVRTEHHVAMLDPSTPGARRRAAIWAAGELAPLLAVHERCSTSVEDLHHILRVLRSVAGVDARPSGHKRTFS